MPDFEIVEPGAPSNGNLPAFEIVEHGAQPTSLSGQEVSLDGIRVVDAGETLVVPRNALEHVQQSIYTRYRPSIFRSFMQVDNSIPAWADSVVYGKFRGYAQWQPGKEDGTTMPGSAIERTEGTFRPFDFYSSFGYTRQEILKTARTGVSLPTEYAKFVMMGAEQTLEDIAYQGRTDLPIGGLADITGTTTATPSTKTGGGTAWTVATATLSEILTDLIALTQGVVNGSKQNSTGNLILMPLERLQHLETLFNSSTDSFLLDVARRALTGVRLVGWFKLNGTGTAYCYDSQDSEVLSMVIPVEPMQMTPLMQPFGGVRVPVMMSTAGVISKFPAAIAKMENI